MMRPDDDKLQSRFDERLAGIEAHVPEPPPWRSPATGSSDDTPTPGRLLHVIVVGAAAMAVTLLGAFLFASLDGEIAAPEPAASPGSSDVLVERLETVEVEPGVLRITHDGYRGLTWRPGDDPAYEVASAGGQPDREARVHVTPDGRVFLFHSGGHFELGEPETYPWPGKELMTRDDRIAVAADGTPFKLVGWRPASWGPMNTGGLWTFDGAAWEPASVDGAGSSRAGPAGITADPDGSVWLISSGGVYRLGPDGWVRQMPAGWGTRGSTFSVDDDGTLWEIGTGLSVYRAVGEAWEPISLLGLDGGWPADSRIPNEVVGSVGRGGVLWAHVRAIQPDGPDAFLARLDAGEWAVFGPDAGVPMAIGDGFDRIVEVAADGAVWLNPGAGDEAAAAEATCEGLARFDGVDWRTFLAEHCIHDIDIGPDGRVWVLARPLDEAAGSLFSIDAEALARPD